MTVRGLSGAALCSLLAAGCAGAELRPGATAWRLPESYQANQVVRVTLQDDDVRDFLASVVRRGSRVEVVLFEPSLQIPLLRASAAPGEADETVFVEGVPSGNGRRLAELVRTMNGLDFLPAAASSLAAEGGGWRFSLSGWVGEAACKFPERISVEHHLGGPRIDVETTDVSCAEPAR